MLRRRVCCSVLQCVAACCSVLQCVAESCSMLQRHVSRRRVHPLTPTIFRIGVLHLCVAVCCRVLQCVAVWCSVLQCGAVGVADVLHAFFCIALCPFYTLDLRMSHVSHMNESCHTCMSHVTHMNQSCHTYE